MGKSNRLLWTVILLIGLMLQPAFGQTEQSEQNSALEKIGIYPYPSEGEVKDSVFSSEGFIVSPLSADDINQDFSNIEDLTWLGPIAKEHRVVLLGETHYYQYIQHLRNRILFALNTFNDYPYLILERQYSITPFLNFYLLLEDEEEAREFEWEIEAFFMDESDYQLLQHLRRWNKTHPNRKIQVGCSDIEHDYSLTFQYILLPYFFGLKQAFVAAGEKFPGNVSETVSELERIFDTRSIDSPDELNKAFRPVEQFVALAKKRRLVGKYSFLTPEYIENVIENLKSTYNAKTRESRQFRQQAIIRNLTDARFLGNYFTTGKVLLHAGGYHTATHSPYPEGQNFLREGSYLTYEFEPTKGKTYSLNIWGLAFSSVLETKEIDIDAWGHLAGTSYGYIVRKIQQEAAQGLLAPDTAYYVLADEYQDAVSPGMVAFMKRILSIAYQYQNQPLLFQQIPWNRLFEQASQLSPEYYKDMVELQKGLQQHDLNILVPVSPLIVLRKRVK